MKVYGITVHGYFTDEWNVRTELQYGRPWDWKLFSKEDDAKKFQEEIVKEWSENWIEKSRIDGAVFMRPRNLNHDKDVAIISIVEFQLD